MNGLLIANKPAGWTSHDVVARVRALTGQSSVGHLGTLDPMATGVLPLLLGNFTRLARFFGQDEKRYTGAIRFGISTDSYDADGEPVALAVEPDLTLERIRSLAAEFIGTIEQTPPPFSAKKVRGIPAHKLARKGKPVELRAIQVKVRQFEILDYGPPDAAFDLSISSGGYVRSIAHEMGKKAGCGAHLARLCRIQAGDFTLEQAATPGQISDWAADGTLAGRMAHPRTLLPEMPSVTVDQGTAMRLRNGMVCNLPEYSAAPMVKIFTSRDELFAIGRRLAGTLVQPMVVLG
jgi:tRNA pseudouridine55 synthase